MCEEKWALFHNNTKVWLFSFQSQNESVAVTERDELSNWAVDCGIDNIQVEVNQLTECSEPRDLATGNYGAKTTTRQYYEVLAVVYSESDATQLSLTFCNA